MNVENLFSQEYKRVAGLHNGGFVPQEAAAGLAQEIGRLDLEHAIRGILSNPQFEDALYPDVSNFLDTLQQNENHAVTLWTQGEAIAPSGGHGYQIAKIARSRISGYLGSSWRSQERMIGIPRVVGGFDKIQILPALVEKVLGWNPEHIVLVDDKAKNLQQAATLMSSVNCSTSFYCINRDAVDVQMTSSEIQYEFISSLDAISPLATAKEKTAWILDLDYTLLDHEKVKNTLAQQLMKLVEREMSL